MFCQQYSQIIYAKRHKQPIFHYLQSQNNEKRLDKAKKSSYYVSRMRITQKILLSWVSVATGFVISNMLLGNRAPFTLLINDLFSILVFLFSVVLVKYEPNRKNKFLFLNFAIFFSLPFFILVFNLIGPYISSINSFLPFIESQYEKGLYYFALAFAVVYVVIDSLFREISVRSKYLIVAFITGFFFILYFYNFLLNPKFAYTTEDVKDYVSVHKAYTQLNAGSNNEISAEEIAKTLTLKAWKDNQVVGDLYPEKNLERIKEIYPYLEGINYSVLLYKPVNVYVMQMSVFVCFFIILFFGYQYKKDPPQGAYIDKMMFLLLLFSSLEILHAWSYIHTVDWDKLTQMLNMGQYLTILVLVLLAGVMNARLRFVTSASGEFYESQLVSSAQHISRWRDWVDNLVLFSFFNPKAVEGTLFSQRRKK